MREKAVQTAEVWSELWARRQLDHAAFDTNEPLHLGAQYLAARTIGI
jgi:hypothetical protein